MRSEDEWRKWREEYQVHRAMIEARNKAGKNPRPDRGEEKEYTFHGERLEEIARDIEGETGSTDLVSALPNITDGFKREIVFNERFRADVRFHEWRDIDEPDYYLLNPNVKNPECEKRYVKLIYELHDSERMKNKDPHGDGLYEDDTRLVLGLTETFGSERTSEEYEREVRGLLFNALDQTLDVMRSEGYGWSAVLN